MNTRRGSAASDETDRATVTGSREATPTPARMRPAASRFQTALISPMWIGTSQFYQTAGHSLGAWGTYSMLDSQAKQPGFKSKITGSDLNISVHGAFNADPLPVKLGLWWEKDTIDFKVKDSGEGMDSTTKVKQDTTHLGPFAVYEASDEIAIGLVFLNSSQESKTTGSDKQSADYTKLIPSVTYHEGGMELSATVKPRIEINDADATVAEPGSISVGGQFESSADASMGFRLDYIRRSELSDDESNQFIATVGAEMERPDASRLGGYLNFSPSYAREDEDKDIFNVMHFGVKGLYERPWSQGYFAFYVALDYGSGKGKGAPDADGKKPTIDLTDIEYSAGVSATRVF